MIDKLPAIKKNRQDSAGGYKSGSSGENSRTIRRSNSKSSSAGLSKSLISPQSDIEKVIFNYFCYSFCIQFII
jgi:hypothetical protein